MGGGGGSRKTNIEEMIALKRGSWTVCIFKGRGVTWQKRINAHYDLAQRISREERLSKYWFSFVCLYNVEVVIKGMKIRKKR